MARSILPLSLILLLQASTLSRFVTTSFTLSRFVTIGFTLSRVVTTGFNSISFCYYKLQYCTFYYAAQ